MDPYFRDAWDDIVAAWGREKATERLFNLAPVVFRPDALVARSIERGLKVIGDLGFVPIAHRIFRYNRLSVREGWRYQLNIATRDRIDVMDMIMPASDSLYIVMKRTSATSRVPATTRLSSCKGPSLPEHREPHHLRRLLGVAQVSVLTYVHISDEPADIVRELGIFFDRTDRLEILRAIETEEKATQAIERAAKQLYSTIPPHNIQFADALDRIEQAAAQLLSTHHEIVRLCSRIRHGTSRDWRRLLALIDAAPISVDHWDRVAVAASLAEKHFDAPTIIPDVSELDWNGTETEPEFDRGTTSHV